MPDHLGVGTLVRKLSSRSHKRTPSTQEFFAQAGERMGSIGGGRSLVVHSAIRDVINTSKPFVGSLFGTLTAREDKDISVEPNFNTTMKSSINQDRLGTDEPDPTIVEIDIFAADSKERRLAIADTGSDDNFIALRTVQNSGLEDKIQDLEVKEQQRQWRCGTDTVFKALGKVSVRWCVKGGITTWDVDFFVVESHSFDVILGKHFLHTSKFVVINPSALLVIHRTKANQKTEEKKDVASKEKKAQQIKENKQQEQEEKNAANKARGSGKGKGQKS